VPEIEVCTGVAMTGERELFVGKWRWYNTLVEEWFDVGPSNWLYYTPQNQGFEYYFTVSVEGEFKGYQNGVLIHSFILSSINDEHFDVSGSPTNSMTLKLDCTTSNLDLRQYSTNLTDDSIHTVLYPFNFDDQENHLRSKINYFVKE